MWALKDLEIVPPVATKSEFKAAPLRSLSEQRMDARLRREFDNAVTRVAKQVKAGRKITDVELKRLFSKAIAPDYLDSALAQVNIYAIDTGIEADASMTTRLMGMQHDYLKMRTAQLTEVTQKGIAKARAALAANEELTAKELQEFIKPVFSANRAQMIAHTETTYARSAAAQAYTEYLKEQGVEYTEIWRTRRDPKVCDACRPRDGWPIKKLGERPGKHPRCRCWVEITVKKAAKSDTKHLPGRHDQLTHGHGGGSATIVLAGGIPRDVTESNAFRKYGTPDVRTPEEGNKFINELAREVGSDGLSKVVSEAEMDRLVTEGHIELFRGEAKPEYAEQLKHGAYRASLGSDGDGYYAAKSAGMAHLYAQDGPSGVTLRMALDKDANVAVLGDLFQKINQGHDAYMAHRKKIINRLSDRVSVAKDTPATLRATQRLQQFQDRSRVVADVRYNRNVSIYALMHGYDAISIPMTNITVVLSRNALYVQDKYVQVPD
jgi:hypothetical protein